MKQVLIKKGRAVTENVPAPQVEADKVLVRVVNSCISIGTEMSGVRASAVPLWKRALKERDKVKKVLDMVAEKGVAQTRKLVKGKLEAGSPVGYSAAGVVIGVGTGIRDVKVGEHVACAGAQCAHHAEIINVPRNLLVKIPDLRRILHDVVAAVDKIDDRERLCRSSICLADARVVIDVDPGKTGHLLLPEVCVVVQRDHVDFQSAVVVLVIEVTHLHDVFRRPLGGKDMEVEHNYLTGKVRQATQVALVVAQSNVYDTAHFHFAGVNLGLLLLCLKDARILHTL